MLIAVDPNLSVAEGADVHARVFAALAKMARAKVADELGDDLAHAEFLGEASIARGELVRSLGGGRIEVDPELYAQLEEDEGIIVLGADDDDLNPPSAGAEAASSESYAEQEAATVAAEEAALAEAQAGAEAQDAEQADALAANDAAARPGRKAAAKKAPAKKAPARKAAASRTPAKKAPAKKAPAKKSARSTKKAAG